MRLFVLLLGLLAFGCSGEADETVVTAIEGEEIRTRNSEHEEVLSLRPEDQGTLGWGILCNFDDGTCEDHFWDSNGEAHWGEPNWTVTRDGAGVEKAACMGSEGECFPCSQAGVGCFPVADNKFHTWCAFADPHNQDLDWINPGLETDVWLLDTTDSVLPSRYSYKYRKPSTTFEPTKCAGMYPDPGHPGFDTLSPVNPLIYPTKTDVIYNKESLGTPAAVERLCQAGTKPCPGPQCNNPHGNVRWLTCGGTLFGHASDITWNNGFGSHGFRRAAGTFLTFDDEAIAQFVNRTEYDPGGTWPTADKKRFLYADLNCKMVGRTLGLNHDNSNQRPRGSCMVSNKPTAADSLFFWHEQDALELLNTYDRVDFGFGHGEEPPNRYAPPLGTTEY